MIIKRKEGAFLKKWLHRHNRKPLIIRGARQVGKSSLVQHFCDEESLVLCEINLEKTPSLNKVFKSFDTKKIIQELEGLIQKNITQPNTLLFLDEIQATPAAIPALRYLYEDYPNLPIIAAGSLLEFTLKKHTFSMPVGRIEYLYLGPLSFLEFLKTIENPFLANTLENFSTEYPIPESTHNELLKHVREFMVIGGMPEAITTYRETNSLEEVKRIQQNIIDTYKDDFSKYASSFKEVNHLHTIINYIPSHVGEKIKYSNISRDATSSQLNQSTELLHMAKLITKVTHSSCSGIPLQATENPKQFKCLFLDIGLMNRMNGLELNAISKLDDYQLINEGPLAEQFIGQELLYRKGGIEPPKLHYWIREKKSSNAEIDYAIQHQTQIIPIEVKAGKSGSLRSGHQFLIQKNTPDLFRFDTNPLSTTNFTHTINNTPLTYTLHSLPLYTATIIELILSKKIS